MPYDPRPVSQGGNAGIDEQFSRNAPEGKFRVIGVDTSPEMLERARQRVPEADLRPGRLEALFLDDASVDLAVCALALTHLPELGPAIAELARVVRPGGRATTSGRGFTLLELTVAMFLLLVAVGGLSGAVISSLHLSQTNEETAIADEEIGRAHV